MATSPPNPVESHRLSSLHTILSTGSPLKPESYDYVYSCIKKDVLLGSISGGTDIISCFAGQNPTTPVYRGEIQGRNLAMAVECWNDDGEDYRSGRVQRSCDGTAHLMQASLCTMRVESWCAQNHFLQCPHTFGMTKMVSSTSRPTSQSSKVTPLSHTPNLLRYLCAYFCRCVGTR